VESPHFGCGIVGIAPIQSCENYRRKKKNDISNVAGKHGRSLGVWNIYPHRPCIQRYQRNMGTEQSLSKSHV